MKHPRSLLVGLFCLLSSCATMEQGPDDGQKVQLNETASKWARHYNEYKWDSLGPLYAQEVNFHGEPISSQEVIMAIRRFRKSDLNFQVTVNPDSWVLDSMNNDIYAGHLFAKTSYEDVEQVLEGSVQLNIRLVTGKIPEIVAQTDFFGTALHTLRRWFEEKRMAGQDFDESGKPNLTFWEKFLDVVRPKMGQIVFCSKFEGKRLLYAKGQQGSGKMGIYDDQGNVVLPCQYDDIGCIGILLAGAAEVRLGEKYGLMGMNGSSILPVEYDAILPVFNSGKIALWGNKDGTWQAFDAHGIPIATEGGDHAQGPDWATYLKSLPLHDKWNPNDASFQGSFLCGFEGEDDVEELRKESIFRAPFSLAKGNILMDTYSYSGYYSDGENGGFSHWIDHVTTSKEGNIRVISLIERWGISAREEFHSTESKWVVFEPEMNDTLQSQSLTVDFVLDMTMMNGGKIDPQCYQNDWQVLGDSMLQVRANQSAIDYSQMPLFSYFKVMSSGKLVPLLPERQFPFMSLLPIEPKMLEGCFMGSSNEAETEKWYQDQKDKHDPWVEQSYKDGSLNLLRTAHFYRASDFDYLVNEVYAAHGYIFTKPKWQEYFKTQNWYKPEHKDVEDKITPLERANIDYMRQLQLEIQGNENSYTNPAFELQTGWSG